MNKVELANQLGISHTVYSLIYRETQAVNEALNFSLSPELYGEPWTGKQDEIHEEFFKVWADYSSPVTGMNFTQLSELFPHYYPTNGSSEAIREVIAQIGTSKNPEEYIVVFEGEYEGYRAYANSYGVRVVEIPRTHNIFDFKDMLADEGRRPHIFISQPSSIDGNVWNKFQDMIEALEALNTLRDVSIKVHVDLCYVGCTHGIEYNVDLSSTIIETIFFSLSKVYGVYYHRIGGVFSKKKLDALWGNRWFKNIRSIELGTKLMREIPYGQLQNNSARYQKLIVEELSNKEEFLGVQIEACDVTLLAKMNITAEPTDLQKSFARHSGGGRMCITPALSVVLSPTSMNLSTDPLNLIGR